MHKNRIEVARIGDGDLLRAGWAGLVRLLAGCGQKQEGRKKKNPGNSLQDDFLLFSDLHNLPLCSLIFAPLDLA